MTEVAEDVLAKEHADMESMTRTFLADPYFVHKAKQCRSDMHKPGIVGNQACLDHRAQAKREA